MNSSGEDQPSYTADPPAHFGRTALSNVLGRRQQFNRELRSAFVYIASLPGACWDNHLNTGLSCGLVHSVLTQNILCTPLLVTSISGERV